jgi:hypothetical protein
MNFKSIIIFISFYAFNPCEKCVGQSSLQLDLDHIVDISRTNLAFEVEYLQVGKIIDITFWEHGCGMMKPLERTLRIKRNPDSYAISFCELEEK